MRRRPAVTACALLLGLAACQRTWGGLLVTIELAGDAETACVGVTVGSGRPEVPVPRAGRDTLRVAVSQDQELTGAVPVTVQRYQGPDCTRPLGLPRTQQGTLALGQVASLTFSFAAPAPDGGPDGGPDAGPDGGADGGCACAAPACQVGPGRCLADGGCEGAGPGPARSACDGGLCDGLGACRPPCQVLADLSACDDGLSCTSGDRCLGGACQGTCSIAPQCQAVALVCATPAACQTTPLPDGTGCTLDAGTGLCLLGACARALPFQPSNLAGPLLGYPTPTGDWVVQPGCEAVLDTGLALPAPTDGGWCAAQGPAADVRPLPDGGQVAVFAALGLQVGAGATIHFVGARPAVVVVLGDATVLGTLSAGATTALAPAGSDGAACADHNVGLEPSDGGGGGGAGFGTTGGPGGNDVPGTGLGGQASAGTALVPLRGGCRGGGGALGGVGGGALQLTVGGRLLLGDAGVVTASGGGGLGGPVRRGGGGGGSGGAVLLEASQLLQLGFVTVNGGGGGEGGSAGKPGEAGATGAVASALPAPGGGSGAGGPGGAGGAGLTQAGTAGGAGGAGEGGGGGGGAVGRYTLKSVAPCQATLARLSGVAGPGGNCP